MNPYEQKLMEIQQKLYQVLRIKKQLEDRRLYYLKNLSLNNNPKDALDILLNLENTYKREERVIKICEKGLAATLSTLADVENVVNSFESFPKRVESKIKSMIPIIGKKSSSPQSLILLIKIMYNHLSGQIVFIDKNLHIIKSNIAEQYKQILELILEAKKGEVSGDITKNEHFKQIEDLRKEEFNVVQVTASKLQSKKGKMLELVNKLNVRLSQNQKLLKLQAIVQIAPIVTPGAVAAGIFLGPQFIPLAYLLLNVVKYSPILAIAVKESALLLKNPAKRMAALANLRLEAAKLGLINEAERVKQTMIQLRQSQMGQAFAYP